MGKDFYLDLIMGIICRLKIEGGNINRSDIISLSQDYNEISVDNVTINLDSNYIKKRTEDAITELALKGILIEETKDCFRVNLDNPCEAKKTILKEELFKYINSLKINDYVKLTFIKRDSNIRNIKGTVCKGNSGDGFILINDEDVLDSSPIRTVDIRKITRIYINNIERIVSDSRA